MQLLAFQMTGKLTLHEPAEVVEFPFKCLAKSVNTSHFLREL